jgi:tRNA pseudouridine55 synthase
MDGLLIIDKPADITSHDVVSRVRRILGTRRVGHTGTLDPFATGVMGVVVGRATRLAQFLDKDEKEYEATIRFGFETDTGDGTGTRKPEHGIHDKELVENLVTIDWTSVLSQFNGEIEQTPPMYSAKKIAGKKLYESARQGIDIERKPQRVNVHKLEVNLSSMRPDRELGTCDLAITVACSAGTYIRVLAEDIGRTVGVGAHLTALRRTRSGRFDLTEAITLEDLAGLADPASALLPIEQAVKHLAEVTLPDERVEKTRHGMSTRVVDATFYEGETIRMSSTSEGLIAIGVYSAEDGAVKPKVVLV